jgi:hypothetical protein
MNKQRAFVFPISKTSFCKLLMIAAPLFFSAATFAMMQKQEPYYTWFYSFAWWSYIIFVQSFLFSRGHDSLLFDNPSRFLLLLPLSVTIWLVFETFNFRLQNWHYHYLPSPRGLRWLGYTIAFATVLPAIFSTRSLLDFLGLFRGSATSPKGLVRFRDHLMVIGIVMLVLPLLFPKIFFPLVWLGFGFLLEPFNYRSGEDSILRDLEEGLPRPLHLLLLSGLLCGILWECWNFGAGSKWVYTIPYLGFLRIFEMPILGFLGFPPFAVECYVMVNTSFLLINRTHQQRDSRIRALSWIVIGTMVVVFDLLCYIGIDSLTVVALRDVTW